MKFVSGYCSDKGNVRENNEDAIVIRSVQDNGKNFLVAAVCDGIGGLDSGELASEFLTRKINAWFNAVAEYVLNGSVSRSTLRHSLTEAVVKWNEQLVQYMLEENLQMGTTMSLIMIVNDMVYGANVGDSRVYCYNHERLRQFSEDTSVSKFADGKVRSYLESYMGKDGELWVQGWEKELEPGDLYVLCSDGFYKFMTEEDAAEMYKLIDKNTDPTLCCRNAVKMALERGSRDNVTLGLVYAGNPKKQFFPFKLM